MVPQLYQTGVDTSRFQSTPFIRVADLRLETSISPNIVFLVLRVGVCAAGHMHFQSRPIGFEEFSFDRKRSTKETRRHAHSSCRNDDRPRRRFPNNQREETG